MAKFILSTISFSVVEAIAIKEGKIVAIGATDDLLNDFITKEKLTWPEKLFTRVSLMHIAIFMAMAPTF